ncbi:hypothetical protein [Clostridium pasteurianum]|uniref:Phage transcriptional activator, RinA family n=1 Tax=Clostridium pasteurianum BC1 TaxID=86416 RepID=R4K8Z1_CLOPA|nr:hypothetical protein [Clostridium pasteurianum]AGK98181.1 hypothetical protein Clopa_3385 [Clostridium pasteurianum BC1]
MDDRVFKKIESDLYNYKYLNVKIENLKIKVEDISNSYDGCTAISYEERTGKTNKFNSSVENEVVNRIENAMPAIGELERKITYYINLKKKIDNALTVLSPMQRQLVELRYFSFPTRSWVSIERDLHMNKDYCCTKRKEVITLLSKLI